MKNLILIALRNRMPSILLTSALLSLSLSSCQDEDQGFNLERIKKLEYAKQFEKEFGTIDPNHDWSMATLVHANVNLPEITGTAKMNIMTGDPRLSSTRLLAQIMLNDGQGSIDFDAVKGMDKVFVTVEQNKVYKIFGEFGVSNGRLMLGDFDALTRGVAPNTSFSSDCPTTLNDQLTLDGSSQYVKYQTVIGYNVKYGNTEKSEAEWYSQVSGYNQYTDWSQAKPAFTDESVRHYSTVTLNFDNTILKDANFVESYTTWDGKDGYRVFLATNGKTENAYYCAEKSIDDWKADYRTNAANVVAGTYNGPWTNESIGKVYNDCTKDTPGASYIGLYPQDHWVWESDTTHVNTLGDRYITLQYLDNVETIASSSWTRGWGYDLFGPKAFFQEQQYYYAQNGKTEDKYNTLYGSTEEEKLATLAKIESGFKIKTNGGPIELPFIYGATSNVNQFGYVFYADGEDPLAQTHYVLMEDGRPDVNIYYDQWYGKGIPSGYINTLGTSFVNNETGGFTDTHISTWIEGLKSYVDAKDNDMCQCEPATSGQWSEPGGTGTPNDHADYCQSLSGGECNCWAVTNPIGTGIYSPSGTHLPSCTQKMTEYTSNYNMRVVGTTYRLVYFDPVTGNATYNIPENLNVVFFICPVGTVADLTSRTKNSYRCGDFMYSLPELNKRINHKYFNTASHSYENDASPLKQTSESGAVKACAWVHDGKTFLGFEDGGSDEDLNDIVFMVSGNFETNDIVKLSTIKWHTNNMGIGHDTADGDLYDRYNIKVGTSYTAPTTDPVWPGHNFLGWSTTPDNSSHDLKTSSNFDNKTAPEGTVCYFAIWDPMPTPEDDPEPFSWIFACEDLGGSFDYDFNDVVWEVKNTFSDGHCTGAQVSVLAAGGTLPFTLKYNNTKICTKTEAFDGISNSDVVNAGSNTVQKTPKTFNVTGIDGNWTVSENYTKFSVEVESGQNRFSINVNEYNKDAANDKKTPQVILLPGQWEWPTESTPIDQAYTNFSSWVSDHVAATWETWSSHKQNGKTVSR